MAAGETIEFFADGSTHHAGFTICGVAAATVATPPPPPPMTPTTMWRVTYGHEFCQVTRGGACVTDGEGNYGANEACTIEATRPLYATADYYAASTVDHMTILGVDYFSSTGPLNLQMAAGDVMYWHTNGAVHSGGFTICGTEGQVEILPPSPAPPAPPLPPAPPGIPPSPAVPPGSVFRVVSGIDDCHINVTTSCVDDGPGRHSSNELCYVEALTNLLVTATYFDTERDWDYVEFGPAMASITGRPNRFSGSAGPVDYPMPAGMLMKWRSDYSGNNGGFVICGTPAPSPSPPPLTPPPPMAPTPPPPPKPVPMSPGASMSAAVEATFAVGGYTAASFPQDAFVTKLAEAVQVSVNSISLAVSNARRDRARNLQTSGVTVVATIIAESDDLATSISSALAVDTDTLASSLGVTLTAPVSTVKTTVVVTASPPPPTQSLIIEGSAAAQSVEGTAAGSGLITGIVIAIVVAAGAVAGGYFLYVRMAKMKSTPSVVLGSPMPVQCNIANVSSTASSGGTQEVELGAATNADDDDNFAISDDESKI